MKRQVSGDNIQVHGAMHITPERIQMMGMDKAAEAMKAVRNAKNSEIEHCDRSSRSIGTIVTRQTQLWK